MFNNLTLEIGSGHNPHPKADILCDKYLLDNTERGGGLKRDRPLVIGDAQSLPFRTKAFKHVICIQVVEHADDIDKFLVEIQRVARSGYIECPSEIAEKLFHWSFHRWYVNMYEDKLIFKPKNLPNIFGNLFHSLAIRDKNFQYFISNHPDIFMVKYWWKNSIKYLVLQPNNTTFFDLSDEKVINSLCKSKLSFSLKIRLYLKTFLPEKWFFALSQLKRKLVRLSQYFF